MKAKDIKNYRPMEETELTKLEYATIQIYSMNRNSFQKLSSDMWNNEMNVRPEIRKKIKSPYELAKQEAEYILEMFNKNEK